MGIDPRMAHIVDGRHLMALLPGLDPGDLDVIRRDFAAFLEPFVRRGSYRSWQEAWNAFTGAHAGRPGHLRYTPRHCRSCGGRGFTSRHVARNLARTGNPAVCGECLGSRRGTRRSQVALYATPPTAADVS